MSKLSDALRKNFKSPREAAKALGIDESLLDIKRLAFDGAIMKPTRIEYLAVTRTARAISPLIAMDKKVELAPIFKGLTTKNLKERKPTIMDGLKKALTGNTIAKDASIEHVANMLDHLEHVTEPKSLDESVSPEQHKAMEAAAHGHSNLDIPKNVGEEFSKADKGKSFGDMIRDWAMSKDWTGGMSDDDVEALNKMHEDAMPEDEMPENALDEEAEDEEEDDEEAEDESEEEKEKKDAKDKSAKDKSAKDKKGGAMDTKKKRPITQDEVNKAIESAVATERKNSQQTAEARAFVRPYVGELPMALDSAEKIHRAAAVAMGIEDADTVHHTALPTLIKSLGRMAGAREDTNNSSLGMDSTAAKSFSERFPGADRIGVA